MVRSMFNIWISCSTVYCFVLDNVCLFGNTYEHYSFPLHCLSIQDSNKTEDCLYVCTSHNDANPYINR